MKQVKHLNGSIYYTNHTSSWVTLNTNLTKKTQKIDYTFVSSKWPPLVDITALQILLTEDWR